MGRTICTESYITQYFTSNIYTKYSGKKYNKNGILAQHIIQEVEPAEKFWNES